MSGTSLDFRLWLSSCSIPDFPISILQSSVKIAYDYPLQLKQSLLRAYRSEPIRSKEFFEGCPGKDKEFSKLLYGLCFFHGIVRGRGHFGPQGWNVPYDFGHVDFEISIRQLQSLIRETPSIPFGTLLYLIGECNYGGKITDRFDQRCLRHLLESFCDTRVIDNAEYSFSNCVEHLVPQRCEYRDIIMHIGNMQLDASAEAFASDENALIIKDTIVAREFLESISRLDQIKSLDDEIIQDQASLAIDEINSKLPMLFNIDEIQDRHPPISHKPLNAILIYEAKLINKILAMIADSLSNLKSALSGKVILTESLEDLSREICNNEVPSVWRPIDVGIVTKYLTSYISLLLKRVNFVQSWYDDDLPRVIYFDALSCCRRFLSAALLTFSRHSVPVEQIAMDFEVTNDVSIRNKEDIDVYYIHNLHLSGARWDMQKRMLTQSLTNIFWYDMPPIRLTFSKENRIIDNVYECPVYVSPMRYHKIDIDMNINRLRNYVTSVPLGTDKSHEYWIKRGTALFCQIEK